MLNKNKKQALKPASKEKGCSAGRYFVKTHLEFCLTQQGNESASHIKPRNDSGKKAL